MSDEPQPLDEDVVNAENPWPGLSSFTEEHSGFFHGRDEETGDIFHLIRRKVLTVLFGQSGLGKTSILQAGLFPRLRGEDFLPVYIRLNHSADAPDLVAQVRDALQKACLPASPDAPASADAPAPREGESLWEYFHREDNDFWSARNRILVPVLVFDQFEEIFTLAAEGEKPRQRVSRLVAELASLIENRPLLTGRPERSAAAEAVFNRDKGNFKIVLSLREDFLANLESLKNQIPSIAGNRFRLTMMDGRQALQAVVQTGGGLVEEDVAEKIIELVAEKGAAAPGEAGGVGVEPTLLSVFCRELNLKRLRRRPPDTKITADLVVGSKDEIISEFYARALRGLDPRVQRFIEERLLTSSGYRNNVAIEDALTHPGIDPAVIATLINRRLFRVEGTGRTPRLELTHDVLAGVIRTSRDERRLAEAAEELKRRQAEVAGELRQKEDELRRTKLRNAILWGACAAVIVFGGISFWQYRKAQSEQVEAESSFLGADSLIDFMLTDLPEKLQPVGQLEVLGATAQRVIDYETKLPPEIVSDPNRQMRLAEACNFQGAVFVVEGEPAKAGDDFQKALGIMQPLVDRNGSNDDFKGELAKTLANQAALVFAEDTAGHLQDSLAKVNACLAVAQATAKPASDIRWNRFLVVTNQLKGRILGAEGDFKDALASFQECVSLGGRPPGDPLQGPFNLGVTYRLMGDIFATQDESQDAAKYYQLSIAQLSAVAAGNTPALYELSASYDSFGALYSRLNQQVKALKLYQQSRQTLTSLTNLDFKNTAWLSTLTTVYTKIGRIYFLNNQLDLAAENLVKGLAGAKQLVASDPRQAEWQHEYAIASRQLGDVSMIQGHPDKAEPFYQDAVDRLQALLATAPNSPEDIDELIHNEVLLGDACYFQGKFAEADTDYAAAMASHGAALALTPNNPRYHNEYSWDLSTCPSAKIRSGPRALQEIGLAFQLLREAGANTEVYNFLGTQAAAYAEDGDFKDAVATQKRAIAVAGDLSTGPLQAEEARLRLYEQGKPYHRSKPQDAFY